MIVTLIPVAIVLGIYFGDSGTTLPDIVDKAVLALVTIFITGFAWSWCVE